MFPQNKFCCTSFIHKHNCSLVLYSKKKILILSLSSEKDEHQIFVKFFKFHCSYDLIPTSAKLVVFDTQVAIMITMVITLNLLVMMVDMVGVVE